MIAEHGISRALPAARRHCSRIMTSIRSPRFRQLLPWIAPVLVAAALYALSTKQIGVIIGAVIGLAVFAVMVRRPGAALIMLAVFLPLQPLGFGLLLGFHVPASILRPASSFKELMGICILVAALREFREGRQRLDRIDKAILAYVLVVTVYLIVPHLFSAGAPSQLSPRLLAWRSDCGYVLVFFGARHAPISARSRQRFFQVVIGIGALTAAVALFQRIAPGTWTHFVLHRAHQPQYLQFVLHDNAVAVADALRYLLNTHPLHVSSIFLSPYDMSDYLLIVAALVAERISRDARSPSNYVLLGAVVGALFFSRVRADALALVVMLVLVVLPAPRRPVEGRIRMILALLVGAALVVPSLSGSRYVGAQGGSSSATGHVKEINRGVSLLVHNPLGLGLGIQPSTITRLAGASGGQTNITTDNSITQVGDELGIQGLLPWLVLLVLTSAALARRARTADEYTTAAGLALLGVLIAGQYHHVFLVYPVPWTLWATVGLALPGATSRRVEPIRTNYPLARRVV
jgi:hypothetical protein